MSIFGFDFLGRSKFPHRIFLRSKPEEQYEMLENVEFFDQSPGVGEVVHIRVDQESADNYLGKEIDDDEEIAGTIETYVVKNVKPRLRFWKRKEENKFIGPYHRQSRTDIYLELITTETIGGEECPSQNSASKKSEES